MKPFENDLKFEQLLKMRDGQPERFALLQQSELNALGDYEALKAEQTKPKRPLRRRYLDNSEKAKLIADNGQESYLAMPW